MRKYLNWRVWGLLLFFAGSLLGPGRVRAAGSDTPALSYSALADSLLQRAQNEVARVKILVDQGTLPASRLKEAETQLADAQDQAILARTLYGQNRVQDMTTEDARAMIDAARRRVDRQSVIVADRRNLVDSGILARSEFAAFQDELDSRRQVLDLAQNRMNLLEELHQMASDEQRLEHAAQSGFAGLKNVMIRFDGNGLFDLGDMTTISSQFQKRFHHPLPISALGQTAMHQAMGLDHRGRVDVALNPDQPEGIWLRQLLERLHIPYLAFRSAWAGAATAPHIHIGTGSTRLKLALR
ncbi:MAG: hypothetical protein WB992_00965 [Bryobacteraceae bacterium]